MTKMKLLAAAAVLSSIVAAPVMAQDIGYRTPAQQRYDAQQNYNSYDRASTYDRSDSGFWPADAAAGIVGGAVGVAGAAVNTAGAIATAPFGGNTYAYNDAPYDSGYRGDYRYSQSYAARNGFVCQPGTWFRGEDGRRHICQ